MVWEGRNSSVMEKGGIVVWCRIVMRSRMGV